MSSTVEKLKNIENSSPNCYKSNNKESLLEKYKIPIQHFDYDYVEKAKDPNELEKIIEVLKSGEEGHYPDLLKAAETKLRCLRPHSRALRQSCPVLDRSDLGKEELEQIAKDLERWVTDVSRNSKDLDQRKTNKVTCDVNIRQYEAEPQPLNLVMKVEPRIPSTDYAAWEKYDPDTEITRIDLESEKLRAEAEKRRNSSVIQNTPTAENRLKKTVTFNQFPSEAEAAFLSNRELEKGRDFFKSGDYNEALNSFSKSISIKPNITNLNNRSITYIKLKNYESAISDCDKVLTIDAKNSKAHLRKAQALEGLRKYEEALDVVDFVIQREPNNVVAQELAERVRRFCRNVLKNTRMKIVEIE